MHELLADLAGKDENLAEAAADSLAKLGTLALPALSPLLESSDPDQRWWAVRTLGGMSTPPTGWLIRALADETAPVRAAAALALIAHPDEGALPGLVQALGDTDSVVAVLVVRALVMLGSPAVQTLIDTYETSGQGRRIQIMRALADIGDHRAIRLMISAIEQDSAAVNYWAQAGLESLGMNMVYLKPE